MRPPGLVQGVEACAAREICGKIVSWSCNFCRGRLHVEECGYVQSSEALRIAFS